MYELISVSWRNGNEAVACLCMLWITLIILKILFSRSYSGCRHLYYHIYRPSQSYVAMILKAVSLISVTMHMEPYCVWLNKCSLRQARKWNVLPEYMESVCAWPSSMDVACKRMDCCWNGRLKHGVSRIPSDNWGRNFIKSWDISKHNLKKETACHVPTSTHPVTTQNNNIDIFTTVRT
jgi:hypothetical protein